MKTSKILANPKIYPRKCIEQVGTYYSSLTIEGLEEMCDDPARNESGQEVQAVLTPNRSGYALSARDGKLTYEIIDQNGRQITFRSIDQAIDALSDVSHLLPEVAINIARWRLKH